MKNFNRSPLFRCVLPFCRPAYTKLSTSDNVVNGVLSRQSKFVESSVADTFGKLKSSDFSIGNYIALGVVDRLKSAVFANHDIDSVTNAIESVLSVEPSNS